MNDYMDDIFYMDDVFIYEFMIIWMIYVNI